MVNLINRLKKAIKGLVNPINLIIESPGIGVGKTTLSKWLVEILPNASLAEEKVDKRVLETLYTELSEGRKNSQKALLVEVYFFFTRIIQSVLFAFDNALIKVYDRGISSSLAFTSNLHKQGLINNEGFDYLLDLFKRLDELDFCNKSNTIVFYLKVSWVIQLERIAKRGRVSEQGITLEYLRAVEEEYEEFVWKYYKNKDIDVITIDWRDYDRKNFLNQLEKAIEKLVSRDFK